MYETLPFARRAAPDRRSVAGNKSVGFRYGSFAGAFRYKCSVPVAASYHSNLLAIKRSGELAVGFKRSSYNANK